MSISRWHIVLQMYSQCSGGEVAWTVIRVSAVSQGNAHRHARTRCFSHTCTSPNRNSAVFAPDRRQTDPSGICCYVFPLLSCSRVSAERRERERHLTRRISSVICYDPVFLQASSLFFFFYSVACFSHDRAPVSCYSLVATQSEVDTQTARVIVQYWPCYCNCCLALLRREKHRTISWGVSLSHFYYYYFLFYFIFFYIQLWDESHACFGFAAQSLLLIFSNEITMEHT